MKREMNVKTRRSLMLVNSIIWLAVAMLNVWQLIIHRTFLYDGKLVMRGMTILLALACAVLYFVSWHRWKEKE